MTKLEQVCPTYVGMNRITELAAMIDESMPHVCGDEPYTGGPIASAGTYAPRMWG